MILEQHKCERFRTLWWNISLIIKTKVRMIRLMKYILTIDHVDAYSNHIPHGVDNLEPQKNWRTKYWLLGQSLSFVKQPSISQHHHLLLIILLMSAETMQCRILQLYFIESFVCHCQAFFGLPTSQFNSYETRNSSVNVNILKCSSLACLCV